MEARGQLLRSSFKDNRIKAIGDAGISLLEVIIEKSGVSSVKDLSKLAYDEWVRSRELVAVSHCSLQLILQRPQISILTECWEPKSLEDLRAFERFWEKVVPLCNISESLRDQVAAAVRRASRIDKDDTVTAAVLQPQPLDVAVQLAETANPALDKAQPAQLATAMPAPGLVTQSVSRPSDDSLGSLDTVVERSVLFPAPSGVGATAAVQISRKQPVRQSNLPVAHAPLTVTWDAAAAASAPRFAAFYRKVHSTTASESYVCSSTVYLPTPRTQNPIIIHCRQ